MKFRFRVGIVKIVLTFLFLSLYFWLGNLVYTRGRCFSLLFIFVKYRILTKVLKNYRLFFSPLLSIVQKDITSHILL